MNICDMIIHYINLQSLYHSFIGLNDEFKFLDEEDNPVIVKIKFLYI